MTTPTRRRRLPVHLRKRAIAHVMRATGRRPLGDLVDPVWRPGHYDGPTDPAGQIRLARFMATGIVPPIYRGNPGACLSLIMMAQALDIPRASALTGIWWNVAIGKGATTAQLMAGLLHRAGYSFKVTEETDKRVAMTFYREVDGRRRRLGDAQWTIVEAVAACLTWRDEWRYYPSDMLWARCLMRGARRYASHIATGLAYTREELDDMSTPAAGGEVATAVQELLQLATDPGTPSSVIRGELVKTAKSRGLLEADTGDGETLGKVLGLLWGQARAREADAERAAAPAADADPSAPAGVGNLPCGCTAEQVLRTGVHSPEVHHA